MSPLRVIILVILFYIAYRLIRGKLPSSLTGRKPRTGATPEMPVSDTLEEDPVCKKLVPSRQAVQYEWQGRTIYFCSQECCNTFRSTQGDHQ